MNEEQAEALRASFPAAQVGKLPRAASKQAAEAGRKGNCQECGKYHVLPAVHIDYVGHAAVTDRLLKVDPEWTWEPLARDQNGSPMIVTQGLLPGEKVGLWINLTIAGVTRPGFGDGGSIKEAIGDALRNAAMRFGVALDLWSKEDLHQDDEAPSAEPATISECLSALTALGSPDPADALKGAITALWGVTPKNFSELTDDQKDEALARMKSVVTALRSADKVNSESIDAAWALAWDGFVPTPAP